LKRENKFTLMLSDEELETLRHLAAGSGRSCSSLLRGVLYEYPSAVSAARAKLAARAKKLTG
jgi:hypothetical protein